MPETPVPPTPEADVGNAPIIDRPLQRQVFVCTHTSCAANGSEAVLQAFRDALAGEHLLYSKKDPAGTVMCTHCGSVGFCRIGPAVMVYPDGVWYAHVGVEDVPEIVESHLKGGIPVERLVRKRIG